MATVPNTESTPEPELPEWASGTWQESGYDLMMDDGDCCREQISLSRKEYLAMKVRLAELRGITLTPEQIEDLNTPIEGNPLELHVGLPAA
jgi:hypothetical protein